MKTERRSMQITGKPIPYIVQLFAFLFATFVVASIYDWIYRPEGDLFDPAVWEGRRRQTALWAAFLVGVPLYVYDRWKTQMRFWEMQTAVIGLLIYWKHAMGRDPGDTPEPNEGDPT